MTQTKYCAVQDLSKVYSAIASFDIKRKLPEYDFVTSPYDHVYRLRDAGYVGQFYVEGAPGIERTSVAELTDHGNWFYYEAEDILYVYLTEAPTNYRLEAAPDTVQNLMDDAVEDASAWLEAALDARFPRPLPKGTDGEYDWVLRHLTSLKAVSLLMLATDPESPVIDNIEKQISNVDGTGLLDKLNKGSIKLSFEITPSRKRGEVYAKAVDNNSTGYIADVYGETSLPFEKLTVTIGTGGTLTAGTDNTEVTYSVTDADGDTVIADTLIDTLYYNPTGAGTYIRFAEGVYTAGDSWYVILRGEPSKTVVDAEIWGGR